MEILNWVNSNKEWLFSGIGVAVIVALISLFVKHPRSKKQIQKSGNDSVNIQVGDNLNLYAKESKDERSQKK